MIHLHIWKITRYDGHTPGSMRQCSICSKKQELKFYGLEMLPWGWLYIHWETIK